LEVVKGASLGEDRVCDQVFVAIRFSFEWGRGYDYYSGDWSQYRWYVNLGDGVRSWLDV